MAIAERIKERHESRRGIRIACAVLFILSSVVYLSWRLTVFNQDAPIVSWLFYCAELIGFMIAFGAIFLSSNYKLRKASPAPEGLDVDVFVTVYKEPLDVVRRTIAAATQIDYPHRTVVLDDGKREEVKSLAEKLGCTYLSRPHNANAKAGNLNFGFKHSDAEFVMVLDADHIAEAHALDAMLGYFEDKQVGLAQSPQDFYNTDCLQFINGKDGALWHDQSYFYHIAIPNADTFNGAICVGTGLIYRRSAVDAIGGIPTQTITEDLHTSLKMQKQNIKTVFHHESLAYGIGEIRLSDFYNVRLRWGHGNIHALRHENVLFSRDLSLRQRLNYLMVGLNYLEGWQYLIFYFVPIFSLLTGVPPFEITFFNIICMIVFPLFTYLLVQEFACGFGRFWVNELYAMIRFPIAIIATLALFRDKLTWKSSQKSGGNALEWSMMVPQLFVVGISLIALIYAILINWGNIELGTLSRLLYEPRAWAETDFTEEFDSGYRKDLLVIAGAWALLNILRGVLFVSRIVTANKNSHEDYRFKIPMIAEIDGKGEQVVSSISLSHIVFENRLELEGQSVASKLYVPGSSIPINIISEKRGKTSGYNFAFQNQNDRAQLENVLYSVGWHRRLFTGTAEFNTPLQYLSQLFGKQPTKEPITQWEPALTPINEDAKALIYKSDADQVSDIKLTTFKV